LRGGVPKNTVDGLKSKYLAPKKFWAGFAAALRMLLF